MSRDNKNIIYTARDIEQYLAGNLSPAEMHTMEKAALDDPFLAEAMEGYEGIKDKEWNNQLVALREQIQAKGAVAKVIPLHKTKNDWRKIAAAVIILGGGSIFTFLLTRDKPAETNNPHIAQTITAVKDSLIQPATEVPGSVTQSLNPSASSAKEEMLVKNEVAVQPKMTSQTDNKSVSEPDKKQLTQNEAASVSAVDDKVIATVPSVTNNSPAANRDAVHAEESMTANNKAAAKSINDAEVLSRQRSQGMVTVKKDQALNNFFTAQIVGADNSPLPFTNISIKKENFGTYADIKGMVRLVSTDSILNVEVKSVGYLPKTIILRSGQPQSRIVLQEDEEAMKGNTVVINKGTNSAKSRRATLVTDSAVNVEPKDGWENYSTYVANNLDIPEEMLNRDLRSEVELTFDVKANGTISNIRVNKSAGAEYDEAAKRLLLEGPQWKVKKGKKTSASLKLQF